MSKRVIAIAIVFGAALGAIVALVVALRTTPDPPIAASSRGSAPIQIDAAVVAVVEVPADAAPAVSDAPVVAKTPARTPPKPPGPTLATPAPTTPGPTTPDPPTPAPADASLSPQERADKARKVAHQGDLAFQEHQNDDAFRLFMQAYELVPNADYTFRVARWYYIDKQYPVAMQWAKLAQTKPSAGERKFQIDQLRGWIRNELLARGLPAD